jgi:TPR repeat protein
LLAKTLKGIGFDLIGGGPRLDLNKSSMEQAIREFGEALGENTIALFYYSGHGVQVQGVNYLIPVDANPKRASDVDFVFVDANLVLKQMQQSGSSLNIIILDACRNNPFGGRGLRDVGTGLAEMRVPRGTLISYSTQPGSMASDGEPGGNSPYAAALAVALQTPGLDVLRAFNQVGLRVSVATQDVQIPWVSSSPIDGDFYPAGKSEIPAAVQPQVTTVVPVVSPTLNSPAGSPAELVARATALGRIGSYDEARSLYKLAADRGSTEGMRAVGAMYQNGLGIGQDYQEAMRWYEKATDKGDAVAFYEVGWLYANGLGVPRDYRKAMAWYTRGADHGGTAAIFQLGWLYQNGLGVSRDYQQAIRLYRRGADLKDAGAMHQLGWMYHNGIGVHRDYQAALSWYRQAADADFAASIFQIGTFYVEGLGVQKDYQEAMSYFRRAAAFGYAPAMTGIGTLYHEGRGVQADPSEALRWFKQAANKNDPNGMLWLGVLYDRGEGVPRDPETARRWYTQAGERSDDTALKQRAALAVEALKQ